MQTEVSALNLTKMCDVAAKKTKANTFIFVEKLGQAVHEIYSSYIKDHQISLKKSNVRKTSFNNILLICKNIFFF